MQCRMTWYSSDTPFAPCMSRAIRAELRRAERAPADSVAGAIQAAERALQPRDARQEVRLGDAHLVHHDAAGAGGAQAELAVDRRHGQALHPALEEEPADLAGVVL